jgi:hypothetical protein
MSGLTVRTDGLVVEAVGDETIVFDSAANVAHTLDGDALAIWRALEDEDDPAAIGQAVGIAESQVRATIEHLVALDLVHDPGLSRRAALRRLAVRGAGVVALPAIASLAIPAAAAAASPPRP